MRVVLWLTLMICFAACTEDVDSPGDTTKPQITITSPTAGQTFAAGQTVSVSAAVTDETKLQNVHLEILNTTTGVLFTHEHYAATGTTHNVAKTFTVAAGTGYRIKVGAEDGGNNSAESFVNISSN